MAFESLRTQKDKILGQERENKSPETQGTGSVLEKEGPGF